MAAWLKRSAFEPAVFEPLTPDYFIPHAEVVRQLLKEVCGATVPLHVALDALMAFYKPAEEGAAHLRRPPVTLWQKLMTALYAGWDRAPSQVVEKFLEANRITRDSVNLSIAAAVHFLRALIKGMDAFKRDRPSADWEYSEELTEDEEREWNHFQEVGCGWGRNAAQAYRQLQQEAEWALSGLPGGYGFTHEALSVLRFLNRPEDFRKRINLLKELRKALETFTRMLPSDGGAEVIEALYGSVSGVSQLRDTRQVFDLLPSELALPPELAALRVLGGCATVRRRSASARPAVFVDKSGSMAEAMPVGADAGAKGMESVPKVSAAAGLALALWRKYRADMYLFDTEVERVQPRDVYRTLLTIEADGGTRIAEVLEEAARLPRTRPVIVLTDGIDQPDREAVERAAGRGGITFVLLPPMGKYDWLSRFDTVEVRSLRDLVSWIAGGGARA